MKIYGRRIRIANKTRFTIAIFVLLVAVLCVLMLAFNTVSGNENIIYKDYVVETGDTLWTIADVESSAQLDTRDVVYHISKANNVGGSDHIYPGQTLKIPTWRNQSLDATH